MGQLNKNEAIKYAVDRAPEKLNHILELSSRLDQYDKNWERYVGDGYTVDQLQVLLADLSAGLKHTTPKRRTPDIVEGVFAIKEHDFAAQPVDVVTFKGHPPKSKFYLAKICRNCGVGMVISFDQIPKDVQQISAAMLTLERVFYKAGHEDTIL